LNDGNDQIVESRTRSQRVEQLAGRQIRAGRRRPARGRTAGTKTSADQRLGHRGHCSSWSRHRPRRPRETRAKPRGGGRHATQLASGRVARSRSGGSNPAQIQAVGPGRQAHEEQHLDLEADNETALAAESESLPIGPLSMGSCGAEAPCS